ncbi:MAG: ATP-binding protein [Desulfatibacillaceae bacterium]
MSRFDKYREGPIPPSLVRAINRDMGRAMHRYDMVEEGDRVAVGLSGGKDSLTLLWFLYERLTFIPIRHELVPIHVDPGFTPGTGEPLAAFCESMGWPLHVEVGDHGRLAHSDENLENPCFLCSRIRRKRLFEIANEHGCNKIAMGHHKDDIIETLFLNMCYAGELATMNPSQPFFDGRITVIRPLALVEEKQIARFARLAGFPEIVNNCPSAATSRRREIKDFLERLYGTNRKIKGNIFRSMSRVRLDYLL